jgi:hypothetical protein
VHLIQILLPRKSGDPASDGRLAATRAELVEQFDGITAYVRAPAQGAWVAPDGRVERDDIVMVEVMADAFDREWWRAYRKTLAERFDEQEIHIRALPADVP